MPDYDGFDLIPERMDDAAGRIATIPHEMESAHASLMSRVDQYKAMNEGAAKTAYSDAQTLWNQGMEQIRQGVAEAGPILTNITEEFRAGDRAGAAHF